MPPRAGVAATGDDANVVGVETPRLATSDPGCAVTDTRDPPREITNTFSLGLPGGSQTISNEPAV